VRYSVIFSPFLCELHPRVAETVEIYRVVVPEITNVEGDGLYPKSLEVVIADPTEDFHYTLLLELNE
jgi:hypothetical protein